MSAEIRFYCTNCASSLIVEADLGGKQASCPKCQFVATVPTVSFDAIPVARLDTSAVHRVCPGCGSVVKINVSSDKAEHCPHCLDEVVTEENKSTIQGEIFAEIAPSDAPEARLPGYQWLKETRAGTRSARLTIREMRRIAEALQSLTQVPERLAEIHASLTTACKHLNAIRKRISTVTQTSDELLARAHEEADSKFDINEPVALVPENILEEIAWSLKAISEKLG